MQSHLRYFRYLPLNKKVFVQRVKVEVNPKLKDILDKVLFTYPRGWFIDLMKGNLVLDNPNLNNLPIELFDYDDIRKIDISSNAFLSNNIGNILRRFNNQGKSLRFKRHDTYDIYKKLLKHKVIILENGGLIIML